LVSINQQVARRRCAARREADTRLADRLGGTWTLLTQVLARPTGTASREAAPASEDTFGDQPTTLEATLTPLDTAAVTL
jgi:hypothetical protein